MPIYRVRRSTRGRLTGKLFLQVLVVFIAVAVGGDEGARFSVADVLKLVGVFFDADSAEISKSAENCGHDECITRAILS